MTISVKHAFQSAKADSGDASLVRPSNWNAEHNITLAATRILGRYSGTDGAMQEITLGVGFSFSGTALTLNVATALGYTPLNKAGDTMSGYFGIAGTGTNRLEAGTGDGASYSNFNIGFRIWYGMGMLDHTGACRGFYDARSGVWDVLGGFFKNGVAVVYNDSGTYNININGSAPTLGGVAAANYLQTVNLPAAMNAIPYNNVGAIAMMRRTSGGNIDQGTTSIGSALVFSNADGSYTSGGATGVWECLGRAVGGSGAASVAVWRRIS